MKRFIEGLDRSQTTLLPECIDEILGVSGLIKAMGA